MKMETCGGTEHCKHLHLRVPVTPQLVESIKAVEGVEQAHQSQGERYTVWICRGRAFTWAEVQPRIEALAIAHDGPDNVTPTEPTQEARELQA